LGSTAFVLGKGKEQDEDVKPPAVSTALPTGVAPRPTIRAALAAGDRAGMRARAEQDLRAAIASEKLQQEGLAVDALALARVPAAAPLLYLALDKPLDVRVQEARARRSRHAARRGARDGGVRRRRGPRGPHRHRRDHAAGARGVAPRGGRP